ncbi:VOC family protein [bacterium]|nr:MAG: VOC family protein [bacterium]
MITMSPYIGFAGKTRDALALYARCFGGATVEMRTIADAGMPPTRPGGAQDVLHAEFKAEGVHLYATDCDDGQPIVDGNRVSLCVNLDDEAEQTRIFDALADGGTVGMPLQPMFWGARFGMLKDRFGIQWMLNCEQKK